MNEGPKFEVRYTFLVSCGESLWYIVELNSDQYLWHDGLLHDTARSSKCCKEQIFGEGYWPSPVQAESFLDGYLARGRLLDPDPTVPEPRCGDVVLAKEPFGGGGRTIRIIWLHLGELVSKDEHGVLAADGMSSLKNLYESGHYQWIGNVFDDYPKSI